MPDRRWPNRFARRLAVFGPAGIVVLTGVLAYLALDRVVQMRRWVEHTNEVLVQSSSLMTALLASETATRGYVLTHDSTLLSQYGGSPQRARQSLDSLRRLTTDNDAQQARVDTLELKVGVRLTSFDSAVKAEAAGKTVVERGVVPN